MANVRILIVEDDLITINLLQKILANNNYDIVNCVTTGLEALEIINNMPVDLILMDIEINGDADGLDIAKTIKKNYNIPSIFITSHSDQITVDKAIETGAFGFIVKPFTKDELFISISIALNRFAVGQKLNQGKLSDDEWNVMKMHSEIGYKIVKAIAVFTDVADDVLCIHERWDGKGYPNGLVGEQIPLNSRIVAIIDAYDAMTNDRSYRKAMSKEAALLEIERNAGTQFDPTIAVVFVKMMREDDCDGENTFIYTNKSIS